MTITIIYHQEPDGCWAESPDLPGFTAVAPTMKVLEQRVEEGIQFYFAGSTATTPTSAASVITKVEVLTGV